MYSRLEGKQNNISVKSDAFMTDVVQILSYSVLGAKNSS